MVLALLALFTAVKFATADFVFELRVYSYRNPTHAEVQSDGRCCDSPARFPPDCSSDCDNKLTFCLRELGATGREISSQSCLYGSFRTMVVGGDNLEFIAGQNFDGGVPNPVKFTGSLWKGGAQVVVKVMDADNPRGPSGDDIVDTITINVNASTATTFTAPTIYMGAAQYARMELSFRAMCTENFYDQDCSRFCEARNDAAGHYRCDDQGNRVCLVGYQDPSRNCTVCVPAVGCSPTAGFCEQPGECTCHTSYGGENCTIDLDPCGHTTPCQHGATCSNTGPGTYECQCTDRHRGVQCELNRTDECDPNPCLNGGNCSDRLGDYNCSCPDGFTGGRCEKGSSREEGNSQDRGDRDREPDTGSSVLLILGGVLGGLLLMVVMVTVMVVLTACVSKRAKKAKLATEGLSYTDSFSMDQNPVYGMPKARTQPAPNTDQPYSSYPTTEVHYYSAVGGNIYVAPQKPESGGVAPNLSARAEYHENEEKGPGQMCHVHQEEGLEAYAVPTTVASFLGKGTRLPATVDHYVNEEMDLKASERTEYYVNEGMGPEQSLHSTHSNRV